VIAVAGRAGEAIALPLTQPAATGYSWLLDLPAGLTRVGDAAGIPPMPGVALGSSAGGALRVEGVAGTYRIEARLARPWERDQPIQMVTIDLVIR
jgi:predicted secreted protein